MKKISLIKSRFVAYAKRNLVQIKTRKSFHPCIFEPKSKVPVDNRSVYQLLSTMRVGKRGDVLKFKSTEKTQATPKPKKRFPMYVDHIHFLVKRAGWKVTNVNRYYTFEQDPFKKEHILRNQKTKQAAVARGDDVQANF